MSDQVQGAVASTDSSVSAEAQTESNVVIPEGAGGAAEASSGDEGDSVLRKAAELKAKQEGQPAAEKKPEVKPEPKKSYKIKVDGSEEELDEDTIIKLAQMGRAANKRFQEAAATKKQAEEFINLLKQNPRQVLEHPSLGLNLKEFAESYLLEQLEKEQMSPEQRKIAEYEAKLREYEEQQKAELEAKKAEQQKAAEAHWAGEYERMITEGLQSASLPKSTFAVKRMANYLASAHANGIEIDPGSVGKLVYQDYVKEVRELFSQSSGETLLQILGDEIANKIRKTDLARLRSGAIAPKVQEEQVVEQKPTTNERKTMNVHEYREFLAKQRIS